MSCPRLSVIIPCRDHGRYLSQALASIERQTLPVSEVLLVDTGSSDDSLRVAAEWQARGFPLEVLVVPDANPARARNAGLEKASGELIGFLDADDLFPAGKLEAQLARFEAAPQVDVVSGLVTRFEDVDPETLAPAAGTRVETTTGVNMAAHVFRRGVFDRIGGFDESFLYSEDTDLVLRLLEDRVALAVLRRETLYYRRHAASLMSQQDPRKLRHFHSAIAKSIQRRKARGLRGDLPRLEELLDPAPERSTS